MKFTLTWTPVIQPLELSEYSRAFDGHSLSVCVNPSAEVMGERAKLIADFGARFAAYRKLLEEQEAPADALEKIQAFNAWVNDVFNPAVNEWYARLFSHGEEKYTTDEIAEFAKVDIHFYNWLLRRPIEMIDEHRTGRKKNSAPR